MVYYIHIFIIIYTIVDACAYMHVINTLVSREDCHIALVTNMLVLRHNSKLYSLATDF